MSEWQVTWQYSLSIRERRALVKEGKLSDLKTTTSGKKKIKKSRNKITIITIERHTLHFRNMNLDSHRQENGGENFYPQISYSEMHHHVEMWYFFPCGFPLDEILVSPSATRLSLHGIFFNIFVLNHNIMFCRLSRS